MNRFENVDVLAALEQLMRQNTAFYRSDFEIDKEIIGRAAASDKAEDRTLLWMSRPSGTHCFRESDVYLQGTRQHNTWKFYGEQTRDRVLAYAVELTGKVRGVIRGNLYELDYPQHFRHVAAEAVQADNIILHYEKGDREQPAGLYFDGGRSCGMRPSLMSRNTCGSCCGRNRKAGRSLRPATSRPTSRRCMTA